MKARMHNKAALFAIILLPIGFLCVYLPTLKGLVSQWLESEDYSHGLLIMPMAAYLIWQKRSELKKIDISPEWRALALVLISILIFILGELGAELFTTRMSMIGMIFGLVWFLCGTAMLEALIFPLVLLFLMIPLPGLIHRNLTFPLQLFSSTWSVYLLKALQISACREGNIIDIGTTQLQVVEACSGLRFIFPLFTLGMLLAYFSQRIWWKRLSLAAAAIPISVLANVVRITGAGMTAVNWGSDAAKNFFHGFSGWFVFMTYSLFYVLLNCMLHRIPGKASEGNHKRISSPARRHPAVTWLAVITAFMLVLLT